jgi:ADP-ribosylglycohydrolase
VTSAVAALIRGEAADAAVLNCLAVVADREGGEELEFLVGDAGRSRQIDGPDQGFTLFTAGIALQVAGEERGFEEGLRLVVGLGGDTDTNAAVAGALLGAANGVEAIPRAWLDALDEVDALRNEAEAMASLVG